MAVLGDLPNEIILQIFKHLNSSTWREFPVLTQQTARPDLCSLSRVNRFYSKLAQAVLFDDVDLHLSDCCGERDEIEDNPWANEDIGRPLLFYKITQDDGLLGRIRQLRMHWVSGVTFTPSKVPTLHSILLRMGQSTSLRELQLSDYKFSECMPLAHPESSAFRQLRKLTLEAGDSRDVMAELLLKICHLPMLQELSSSGKDITSDGNMNRNNAEMDLQPSTASRLSLLSLNIEAHSSVQIDFLATLTSRAHLLRKLATPLFGPGCRSSNVRSRSTEVFQPTVIAQALQPVHSHLEELVLVSKQNASTAWHCGIVIDEHDGSSFDLGNFTKLRRLKISSYLFCHNTSTARGYEVGIYKLLPSSLESLEIEIPPFQGILYDQSHIDAITEGRLGTAYSTSETSDRAIGEWWDSLFLQDNDVLEPLSTKLAWLLDILNNKASNKSLPKLSKLRVFEVPVGPRFLKAYDLVKLYPSIFGQCSNLFLEIQIRGPSRYYCHKWQPIHRDPIHSFAETWVYDSTTALEARSFRWEEEVARGGPVWQNYLSRCEAAYGATMVLPADSSRYDRVVEHRGQHRFCCDPNWTPYRYSSTSETESEADSSSDAENE